MDVLTSRIPEPVPALLGSWNRLEVVQPVVAPCLVVTTGPAAPEVGDKYHYSYTTLTQALVAQLVSAFGC